MLTFGITSEKIAKRPTQSLLNWQHCLRKYSPTKSNSQQSEKKLNKKLFDALNNRNTFLALFLINEGANSNTQDDNGNTLLHIVIDQMYSGLFYSLEEDEISSSFNTVHFLIKPRQNKINLIQAAEFLLRYCRVKLRQNIDGCTPLHDFVQGSIKHFSEEQLAYVIELLTENQSTRKVNLKNRHHISAWMLSILNNTPQSTILAQNSKVKINAELRQEYGIEDDNIYEKMNHLFGQYAFQRGWTDWMIVCFYNNYIALSHMLARPDAVLNHDSYIMSYSPAMLREILSGETPLHFAVVYEDIDLLIFLLQILGPEYLLKTNSQNHTILHKAAHVKCHQILQLLLNFEGLKAIFLPSWELTETVYAEFVQIDSSQGLAASAYHEWLCNQELQINEDYQAFIDCPFYPIDQCDSQGNSLIHMLVNDNQSALLLKAAKRPNVKFDIKNGQGYIALHLAFMNKEESSIDVIRTLASIAKNSPLGTLLTPNYSARYYPNIRKCLSDVIDESLFETPVQGLSVDNLLDVYLANKPFRGQMKVCISDCDVQLESSNLDKRQLSELEAKIKRCIFYEDNFGNDAGLPVYSDDAPELNPEEKLLSKMIQKARDSSDDYSTFSLIIHGDIINVSLGNFQQSYEFLPITIDYERLAYLMDQEWDYKNLCPRYTMDMTELPKPPLRTDIFSFPEIPLLCLLIDQVKFPINYESFAWRKFLAVLEGFYIENLSVNTPERGLVTLVQYSSGEIQTKLLEKFRLQAIGFDASVPLTISNLEKKIIPNLSRQDISNLRQRENISLGNSNQIHWEQLYHFSELFCQRMQQIIYIKRSYASNHELDILTALARLLEGDSTCAAICFHGNKFIISANLESESGEKINPTMLKNKLTEIATDIFSHLQLLAQGKQKESNVFVLLEKIVREQLKLSRNYKRNTQVKQFFDANLSLLIKHVYLAYEKIQSHIIVSEKEELVRESLIDYFQQHFSIKLTVEIIEIIDAISRTCGDILILEESVLTQDVNKKLSQSIFTALQSINPITELFIVLDNPKKVHAEARLLTELYRRSQNNIDSCLMGISKLCCPHCALLLESVRTLLDPQINIHTKGIHNKHCDHWEIPDIFFDNTEILSAYLGGKQSELNRIFVNLSLHDRNRALSIIAEIFMLSKKDGFETHKSFLNRNDRAYSHAPHLMRKIDYSLVHSNPAEILNTLPVDLNSDLLASVARRSGSPLHNNRQLSSDNDFFIAISSCLSSFDKN